MHHLTPLSGIVGGALIGLAASMLMLLTGRIAGISGIFGGYSNPVPAIAAGASPSSPDFWQRPCSLRFRAHHCQHQRCRRA